MKGSFNLTILPRIARKVVKFVMLRIEMTPKLPAFHSETVAEGIHYALRVTTPLLGDFKIG